MPPSIFWLMHAGAINVNTGQVSTAAVAAADATAKRFSMNKYRRLGHRKSTLLLLLLLLVHPPIK